MFLSLFFDHPRRVQESYSQHLVRALGFGTSMIIGGIACIIHALIPGLFVHTASDVIRRLHDRMVVNRRQKAAKNGSDDLPSTAD